MPLPNDFTSVIIFNILTVVLLIISLLSIKKKINHVAILITTVMWGLIPWPFLYLSQNLESVLMIAFMRALLSVLGGLLFIAVSIILNVAFKRRKTWSWFQYSARDLKKQLTDFLPLKNLNVEIKRKHRIPYLLYYFLLGTFYITSVIFYFFSYELLGVIVSSIMNTIAVMLLIALYNLARRLEYMDTIKFTYLSIFLVAGVLTIVSTPVTMTGEAAFYGLIALSSTIILWTLFLITSGLDDYTPHEKNRILSFKDKNTNFQINKSVVKVTFFFASSLLSIIILSLVIAILPLQNTSVGIEISKFFAEFQKLPLILSNVWTYVMAIESTILPYIIYFSSQNGWPSRRLKWDQWVAILAIFEPMTSIFVGFFIGNEGIKFNIVLLALAIILMVLTMFLRYYHEKNSLRSIILLKLKPKKWEYLISRLKLNPNVIELKSITGKYDVLIRTFFQSNYLLKNFIDKLKKLDAVLEMENFIEIGVSK